MAEEHYDGDRVKTCPFCGAAPEIYLDDEITEWFVDCGSDTCVMNVHMFAGPLPTRTAAVAAWNTRAPAASGGGGDG